MKIIIQRGELHTSGLGTECGEKWADMGTKTGSMDTWMKFIRTEDGVKSIGTAAGVWV